MGYENWRFEYAPTSLPDDPFPVWEDLNPWVETVGRPWSSEHGRPTELDTTQPGHLAFTLNNSDHRFSDLPLACQIRVTETIGYRTFQVFRGYLELPDIDDWAEQGVDQFVTVTAVDRLTRLDRGRKFISTQAEYVLYNATGADLQAYYPMLGTDSASSQDVSTLAREPMQTKRDSNETLTPVSKEATALFTAGGGITLPGDDLATAAFAPRLDATGAVYQAEYRDVTWASQINQSSGTATVVGWVVDDGTTTGTVTAFQLGTSPSLLMFARSSGVGWFGSFRAGGIQIDKAVPFVTGMPQLVAVRYTFPSGPLEVWRHTDDPVVQASAPYPSTTWSQLTVGRGHGGSVGGVQVYLGTYTRAMHLAQIAAAYSGLEGQTTGQRIRTVAAYAGMPAGQLAVDDGVARMRRVSLAGKSPLEPMREAETTEQGLLIADGAGELTFADRIRRYNI